VVARLLQDGCEVVVADHRGLPGGSAPTVVGDLCRPETRERAFADDVDIVVHLAAATSVLGSVERPAEVHRTNVEMTAALLECARQHEVGTFVLASTNAVVGDVGRATITETLPLAPLTPYGATKAAAEMLVSGYAGAYGTRAPVLRFTNVYGGGMLHKDSFVPRLMRAAANGGRIEIYGDGEQRRNLVHVDDVAHSVVMAVGGWPTGPVIIGGERSYSVNELVDAAREATGREIGTHRVPAKSGEMPAVIVDIGRAKGLGYEPRVSLAEGLRSAWADFAPSGVGA
jgi:UDP-glucose 4-epimerase